MSREPYDPPITRREQILIRLLLIIAEMVAGKSFRTGIDEKIVLQISKLRDEIAEARQ